MRQFSDEETKSMSQNQVLSIVCGGLAKFTEEMVNAEPPMNKGEYRRVKVKERCPTCHKYRIMYHQQGSRKEKFQKQAEVFRKFSKIFSIREEENKNGKSR